MALYAFDGTWNDATSSSSKRNPEKNTNVYRFAVAYGGNPEYIDGVGSRFGFIGKMIGGLTGSGAEKRIKEQFEALQRNFKHGDTEIDIVGYSRGAAIARMFVHRLEQDFSEIEIGGKHLNAAPSVRFLGLFDTVASFGIPWGDDEGDFRPDIPEFVENTFHAMALDETRETFGIERCHGNRDNITETWFRGGHGDIGGNAVYKSGKTEKANLERSDIALDWMLHKATACGVPLKGKTTGKSATGTKAPVTAKGEAISIGDAGTLSRRIHLGDLVHHSVEKTELTKGIDGRLLRRIAVPTRIENEDLEKLAKPLPWIPSEATSPPTDNRRSRKDPALIELSSRRYPFDVPPARTWDSWLKLWNLDNPGIKKTRLDEFWAPNRRDRAVAWEVYIELQTRITTQVLDDYEGNDKAALTSVYSLFQITRESLKIHGYHCANVGLLIVAYLNQKVRRFTAKWHKRSIEEHWDESTVATQCREFRQELHNLQSTLKELADALSTVADAQL